MDKIKIIREALQWTDSHCHGYFPDTNINTEQEIKMEWQEFHGKITKALQALVELETGMVSERFVDIPIEQANVNEELIKLVEAAERMMFLHMCEQEGITIGKPSPKEWLAAVDYLGQALEPFRKGTTATRAEQAKNNNAFNTSYTENGKNVSATIKENLIVQPTANEELIKEIAEDLNRRIDLKEKGINPKSVVKLVLEKHKKLSQVKPSIWKKYSNEKPQPTLKEWVNINNKLKKFGGVTIPLRIFTYEKKRNFIWQIDFEFHASDDAKQNEIYTTKLEDGALWCYEADLIKTIGE